MFTKNDCQLVCCNPKPLAIIDLETTGLNPKRNEILEVAILPCDKNGILETEPFVTKVRPIGPVGATHIHGITPQDVAHSPSFFDVAGTIIDHLAGRVIVAHNAYFDVRFLSTELTRAAQKTGELTNNEKFPMFPTLCTMWSSDVIGLGGYTSLKNACAHIGVVNTAAHTAAADATATMYLTQAIIQTARQTRTHVRKFGDPTAPPLTRGSYPTLPRLPHQ